MLGSDKNEGGSSKQVVRLDATYFDMAQSDRIAYLEIFVGTMSPNPAVRAEYVAKLNALTAD